MKSVPFAATLLAMIAVAPIFYLLYSFYNRTTVGPVADVIQFEPINPVTVLEAGAVLSVRACSVFDGYKFSLYISGGKQINAHLPIATKEEAYPVVVDLLKKSGGTPRTSTPSVTLLRNVGDYWIVDFYFTMDGNRVRLLDVLQDEDLLLISGDEPASDSERK